MIDRESITEAYRRISGRVRKTPVFSPGMGELHPHAAVTLKLEQLQHTASFKARGAFNALLCSTLPKAGVVAASGGNHGAAVAYAAKMLDIPAEIFVPDIISPSKLARLQSYGARIHVVGAEFAEALEACRQHQDESGAILLHAYDQPEILAGQGTVALELEEQAPDLDTVLIAVGGGGLIGGVASWYQNQTRIIAVESTGTPTLHTALKKGTPCDISVSGSAADSLGARRTGTLGFHAAQHYVDQSLLVEEEAIAQTQKLLWEKFRQIAEPGGATALAALVTGAYKPEKGEHVGVLICGGNADTGKIVDSV